MVSLDRPSSDLSEYTLFPIKKISIIRLNRKIFFFAGFIEILAKFSDFIKSYKKDCIGKITSKSIRLQPVFIKKEI